MQFIKGKEKLVKSRKAVPGTFRKKVCEMPPQSDTKALCQPNPRRNAGLWCVSTRRDQHKAQKEMWLVSGLQDHRYLSVDKDAKMPVDVPLKKQSSVKTRRYVCNQRHAGFTGSPIHPVSFPRSHPRRCTPCAIGFTVDVQLPPANCRQLAANPHHPPANRGLGQREGADRLGAARPAMRSRPQHAPQPPPPLLHHCPAQPKPRGLRPRL